MRKLFEWIQEHIDARDVHAYTGILLIAAGLAHIYWPASLIVSGAILLYLALRGVK